MDNIKFSTWNNWELKLYRLLGIYQFRKLLFLYEKIKHRNDNRRNENYHLSGDNLFSLERFNGYLLYNGFLHGTSVLLTVFCASISVIVGFHNTILDLGMLSLTLFNLYCIILQRNNYLRLKQFRYKTYERFQKKTKLDIEKAVQNFYVLEPQKLQVDYDLLSRIIKALEGKEDCFLTDNDIESLNRICAFFEHTWSERISRSNSESEDIKLIERCKTSMGPYSALQLRIDGLQRKLRVSGRKMLDLTAIVTENAECEQLYRKLFPKDADLCFICYCLYEKVASMIVKVETNA